MTAVATDIHGGRAPRWLMPLLVGSLALNLVVIGAAGSFLWRGNLEPSEAPLARRVAANVVGYAVTLPPERVQDLKRLTQSEWQRVQPLRRSLLAARDEVATILSAQPFDRERFLAAQARLIEADRVARQAMFALHTAISVNLTPEERQEFLRWRQQQQKLRPRNPLDTPDSMPAEPRQ